MKIAVVGYGKMGHMVEKILQTRGHTCVCTVDLFAGDATCVTSDHVAMADAVRRSGAEGVIEFSHPASAVQNIRALLPLRRPLRQYTATGRPLSSSLSACSMKSGWR